MTRFVWGCTFLVVISILSVGPGFSASFEESPCSPEYSQWAAAFQSLKENMDSLKQAKEGSITPKIENEMKSDDSQLTVAEKIQLVLAERTRTIAESQDVTMESLQKENQAFERFRRCGSFDTKRSSRSNSDFNELSRERNRLFSSLRDLLLDEAYVQYKKDTPEPSTARSGNHSGSGAYSENMGRGPGQGGYGSYNPDGYGYQ
jgi:hypothetical protein